MSNLPPFGPGQGAALAVTSTNARTAFPVAAGGAQVVVHNAGSKYIYLTFGTIAAVAVASTTSFAADSYSLPPGQTHTLSRGEAAYIAYVCGGSDTSTLHVNAGAGE